MTRLLRPETAFFLLTLLVLQLAFRERGFYDPGSLWHIKVGELTLKHGIPQTDPFSFTFEGKPWVPQQWGAEVLMAIVHGIGGLDSLLFLFSAGLSLLFTLIFRRCLLNGMGPILAALLVGICLFVGAFHYFVRPHMFTIAFLAWTMACIIDYERGRCTIWRLVWLIPLYIVWLNLHGGVLGGTMTLGLAVGGWGIIFLLRKPNPPTPFPGKEGGGGPSPSPSGGGVGEGSLLPPTPINNWPTAFALVGIVFATFLTPLVNPHGLEMLRIWQRLLTSKVLPQIIHEHMPMDITNPLGMSVVALGTVYIVLLVGTIITWLSRNADGTKPESGAGTAASPIPVLRVSWFVPLAWFVLSFKGIRQGPLFAITAAVALADMWRYTFVHRWLVKNGDGSLAWYPEADPARLDAIQNGTRWWIIPLAVVLLGLGLQAARVQVPVIGSGWVRFNLNFVPADLTPEVKAYNDNLPPGTRIYNDVNLGGYLIYHAPNLKIFGDDRCELYGDEWLLNYVRTMELPPEELGVVFEKWRDQYGFDIVILQPNPPDAEKSKFERYLLAHPERWREVKRGKRGLIFERVK